MKRLSHLLMFFVLTLSLSITVFASSTTYRDESTGTTFDIPEGWTITLSDEVVKAEFSPVADPSVIFMYSSVDIYAETLKEYELADQDPIYKSRAAYDLAFFNAEGAAEAFGCKTSEIKSAKYGEITYYYTERTVSLNAGSYTFDYPVVYLMRVENGILYIFQFYGEKDSAYFSQIEQMLGSAVYTHAKTQDIIDAKQDALWAPFHPTNLILSLLLTVAVYSLPIFIYRWCIRKYPVEQKKAKIIAIVYGICAFIVMSVIMFFLNGEVAGAAVFLWSWINYKVMIGGKDRRSKPSAAQDSAYEFAPQEYLAENFTPLEAQDEVAVPTDESATPIDENATPADESTAPIEESAAPTDESVSPIEENAAPADESVEPQKSYVRFCNKCGFELLPGSAFCSKCGAPVVK